MLFWSRNLELKVGPPKEENCRTRNVTNEVKLIELHNVSMYDFKNVGDE